MLARAHFTYIIIDPIQTGFFCSLRAGWVGFGGSLQLYNFKTSRDIVSFAAVIRVVTTLITAAKETTRDTATKITQNKIFSNV